MLPGGEEALNNTRCYGGGKSWDAWGKMFFHNLPRETGDAVHVAIGTPVINYCAGGLMINDASKCLGRRTRSLTVSILRMRVWSSIPKETFLAKREELQASAPRW